MISIIVAMAKNNVIGKGGDLPWRLSADLKHFAQITKGHNVIMGRKTYESIIKRLGHPLPDRKNIVITSQADYKAPDCFVVLSITEAIEILPPNEEVFIIGGGKIYEEFLPITDKLYITEIIAEVEGDVVFPAYKSEDWKQLSSEHHEKDEKNPFEFNFLELVRK
jgi:dihydrofolate reductase